MIAAEERAFRKGEFMTVTRKNGHSVRNEGETRGSAACIGPGRGLDYEWDFVSPKVVMYDWMFPCRLRNL